MRLVYLMCSVVWFAATIGGRLRRGRSVVLCYHGIAEGHREVFARQMSRIARRAVSLQELRQAGSHRFGRVPNVCITFDDGFENLLGNAIPILEQLGMPATIFIVPDNMGAKPRWNMPAGHSDANERLMDRFQVEGLVKHRGIQVGSHTLTHANLMTRGMSDVTRELLESKKVIENILPIVVTAVAFPFGAFDPEIVHAAESVGYTLACTLEPRLYSPGDGARVGRFSMSPDVWPIEFYLTCAGAYAWLQGWRRLIRAIRHSPIH